MHFLDPGHLIESFGYLGLFLIVFAESGLFFGFFLPGDSLLLTAGLFAFKSQAGVAPAGVNLELRVLLPLLFAAAVLGDNVGYWFGKKTGPPLFSREESLFFKRKNLLAARAFYDRHGGKTIILARFMPFVRTFAPIVAGAVQMPYRRFMLFNLVGGLLWAVGLTLAGFWLGSLFPPDVLDKYFTIIVLVVIVLSVLPTAIHVWKESRHEILARIRLLFSRQPGT